MGGVKERLIQFVSYKRMSKRKFQERISVSNSYIQNISEGIGGEVLNRISKEFPDLNIDWLLTGKGKMLNLNNSNVTINGNENQNNIGGQMINISLPEKGSQKIIKPDGSIEIQNSGLGNNNSNEINRLKEELHLKEIELAKCEAIIKSKDDMICMLKEILDRH
jgi:hypothetical protein